MNVSRGLVSDAQERRPLWLQVKNSVLAMIRDEELQPDAKLPSESEMCRDFGVSRIVVREAMAQLVAARVIYRLQGKGAFVARRDEALSFVGATQGFTGELLEQNHVVTRRILKQFLGPPETKARKLLLLGRDEPAVHLDRVLLVDGTPRIVVRTVLPHRLVPGMEQIPMEGKSLHATLQRQYGISFVKAQRWLAAKSATPDLAELLGVDPGSPLLEIESLAHIAADRPAEYYLAYYRTDQARVAIAVG